MKGDRDGIVSCPVPRRCRVEHGSLRHRPACPSYRASVSGPPGQGCGSMTATCACACAGAGAASCPIPVLNSMVSASGCEDHPTPFAMSVQRANRSRVRPSCTSPLPLLSSLSPGRPMVRERGSPGAQAQGDLLGHLPRSVRTTRYDVQCSAKVRGPQWHSSVERRLTWPFPSALAANSGWPSNYGMMIDGWVFANRSVSLRSRVCGQCQYWPAQCQAYRTAPFSAAGCS